MVNKKNTAHYLKLIIEDLKFIIFHSQGMSLLEFEEDEVLNNCLCFKLIQISENAGKLPEEMKKRYPHIPWFKMSGLRNRIVHDYGSVDLTIVYDTIMRDIPNLLNDLNQLI